MVCCARVCLCLRARVFACPRVYMCLHTLIQEGGCESTICYALFDYKPVPITATVSSTLDIRTCLPTYFAPLHCSMSVATHMLQDVCVSNMSTTILHHVCNRHVATCLCKMYCQTCGKDLRRCTCNVILVGSSHCTTVRTPS